MIEGKAVDLAGSGEGCFEVATPNVAGLCIENIGIVRTTRTINTDAPGFYSFFFFFVLFSFSDSLAHLPTLALVK